MELTPTIDEKVLKEKANEYALKGAIETIKDFYSGYNSPYKKAIEEKLENKGLDTSFELPDLLANINESLSKEIDKIANTAISKSFIPLVTKFLTRASKEMKLSEILKEFISITDFDENNDDWEDFSFEINDSYPDSEVLRDSFFDMEIQSPNKTYNIHFRCINKRDEEKNVYRICGLPRKEDSSRYPETMKISLDGVTLEMPFTKNVLSDPFTSFIARLLMVETKITIYVVDFEEDMFVERDNCHC